MINLLLLAGAVIMAVRILSPWLRMAITVVMHLIGLTFFIAVVILVAIAFLTRGALL
jgi:hypothetical protein